MNIWKFLIIVGIVIIAFYQFFYKMFAWKEDSKGSIKYSKACRYLGIVTGVMFAGVGAVPHDFNFLFHSIFLTTTTPAKSKFCISEK